MPSETTFPVRYWRLEYIKDGSRKFYEIWLHETFCQVWLSWGRMGTGGQDSKSEFDNATDAKAKALAQVYAKQSKGYELVTEDVIIEATPDQWTNRHRMSSLTQRAIASGDATPREAALNYIEGFVTDCNEFLVRAKEGADPDELAQWFEDLSGRWEELKDKYDSAETMMHMVKMRALRRA